MRILGITIREMDSMIQKNLLPGWFPFGDYPMPKEDRYVSLDERDEDLRRSINEKLYGIMRQVLMLICILKLTVLSDM